MSTTLVGTAYRIDGVELGASDIITAGTALTAVELTTIDPDSNDFAVTPRSVIFEGTVNETVLSEAEEIDFFVDGVLIATESPSYEFVSLATDAGVIFGITFFADGDTYFIPQADAAVEGLTQVTADSQIRANDVAFNQLDFGLLPPGATAFEGLVFGPGAIDAPGLGETRTVIDSDDIAFNPGESTEINPFNAEVLVTVTFADGTSLSGVQAFQSGDISFVNNQTIDTRAYAIDVAAIEAVGESLATVVSAEFEATTSHDLTYTDVGFEAVSTAPGDVPPSPEPEVTIITGTAGADQLTGTEGADVFVFGADAADGARVRDVITGYDVNQDLIALEQGVSVVRAIERGNDLRLILDGGDRDSIVIRDADASVLETVVFVEEDFVF